MQTHTHHADDPSLIATSGTQLKACHKCSEPAAPGAKLLFCGGCRSAAYCSAACQRAAWAYHKHVCKDLGEKNQKSRAAYAECKAGPYTRPLFSST